MIAAPGDPNDSTQPTQQSRALRRRYDPERRVVALTGVCNFLGTQLLARLEQDDRYARLVALDIAEPQLPLDKTHFYRVDLTQPTADSDIARVLAEHGVDTVVHLAFLSHPTHNVSWAHELEAIGTLHLLDACEACGVHKVVMRSETIAYTAHPQNPNFLAEKARPPEPPRSRFLRDKLEAERLMIRFQEQNPSTVITILRLAPILGPHIDNYVTRYLSPAVVPTLLGHDPLVQLIGEVDAVDALKLCVDADFRGTYNIAAEGVLPLGTVIALAGRISLPLPYSLARPAARLLWATQLVNAPPSFLDFLRYLCVADVSESKKVIGFTATRDIRQVVADFDEHSAGVAA